MTEKGTTAAVGVLFVDDEENILRSLKRLFMDEDCEVCTASCGEDGLEILKVKDNIGLIVSDQRMPGMKGSEFLEKAKESSPSALRILLTGYSDITAVADAINKGGAYRYITKPWDDAELVQTVRGALQRYTLEQENKRLSGIIRKQNKELKDWNTQLETMVQEQTMELSEQNDKLKALYERQRANFKNTITAFSGLIELRDKNVRNHSRNVAEISGMVARAMKLTGSEVESVIVAALLHDIGKIGIPDAMLIKDVGDMNPEEMKEYSLHPIRGQAAVDTIVDLRDAGLLIRHHHEWYNGAGFPDKLKGDEIPLGARIIAMADFIDRAIRGYAGDDAVRVIQDKVKENLGNRLDPFLHRFIIKPVAEIYKKASARGDMVEMEFSPTGLKPGMVVSRSVKSGTGLLLLNKGAKLDHNNIQTLRRYYRLDPSKSGIFVWVKR